MIFKRKRRLPDGSTEESATYYVKLTWQGRQILRNTAYTARADAERFERTLRKSLAGEREEALTALAASRLRRDTPATTIAQVVGAFRVAPGSWTPHTKRGYIGGLRTLVETSLGPVPAWDSRPVAILDADLVFRFRQAIHRATQSEPDDRRQQAGRTGNTVLRSARALFTPTLLEYYRREAKLSLPDLGEFRDAPGFRGVSKDDYRIPDDGLIERTFGALAASRDTHRDRFIAVWLALGFGLRKSEAAAVRAGWFVRVGGRVHLELRAVVQPGTPGRESTATKNGDVAPRIPVANGAWTHLGPIIEAMRPDQHVLAPDACATYRADALFDEIALWMRDLGWETQKAYHEWRAYGGCQVAMRDGLLVAKDWLRHSSVTTTERNYGRYIRTQASDAPLAVVATAQATTVANGQPMPTDAMPAPVGVAKAAPPAPQPVDFTSPAEVNPLADGSCVRSSIG